MSYNPKSRTPIIDDGHFLKSNYSPKKRVALVFPEDSPFTKQEFKDESDINIILSRYNATGQMPVINQAAPQYLDVTGMDFQTHMEVVAGAQTLFNSLPSALRNRFENDPARFLDFCSNPKNKAEMYTLGLLRDDFVPEAAPQTINPVTQELEKSP